MGETTDFLGKLAMGVIKSIADGDFVVSDYNITIIVDKKIDEKCGVLVKQQTITRRMTKVQAEAIIKKMEDIAANSN